MEKNRTDVVAIKELREGIDESKLQNEKYFYEKMQRHGMKINLSKKKDTMIEKKKEVIW